MSAQITLMNNYYLAAAESTILAIICIFLYRVVIGRLWQ